MKNSWSAHAITDLVFDIKNKTKKKSPEIEAIYFYTGTGWEFEQGGEVCPSPPSEEKESRIRHFIKSPVPRLSPGAWGQIKVKGTKRVWSSWGGEELKEKYTMSGFVIMEVFTPEGAFREQIDIAVDAEELPF